jgi:hypothetical protein
MNEAEETVQTYDLPADQIHVTIIIGDRENGDRLMDNEYDSELGKTYIKPIRS